MRAVEVCARERVMRCDARTRKGEGGGGGGALTENALWRAHERRAGVAWRHLLWVGSAIA